MAPWDDVEVESDGDELLDWLWDFPERYDVGVEEAPRPPVAVAGGVGLAGAPGLPEIRKHLRRSPDAAAGIPPAGAADDDRPTVAMDPVDPFEDDEEGTEFIPMLADESRRHRFTTGGLAKAAAVLLVVAVGIGVGYKLFAGGGSSKPTPPSKLAISGPTTLPTTFDQGVVPTVTTPTSIATTTTPPTTPPPAPAAAASAPPIVSTGTTAAQASVGCGSSCTTGTTAHTTPVTNPPPPRTTPATPPPTTPRTIPPTVPATVPATTPPTVPPCAWCVSTTTGF